MALNLSSLPILDHHCHSFLRRETPYTAGEFAGFFSEGGDVLTVAQHTPNSIFFRWGIKEVARFLGCSPTTEAVLEARSAMPLDELARRMFKDANIPALLIDTGLPGPGRLSVADMRAWLPDCRVEPILRLETTAQELILKQETFDQVVEAFVAIVDEARAAGHVGLKSIIAYRTGLAIRETPRAEAEATFATVKDRARRDGRVRLADKPLNDYLLLRALEVAEKQALPIQFHTGLGDNDLDMLYANPLHMRPLFESRHYKHVPFVLLHASYPYVRELGYLASLYAHVWLDVGLAVPYATVDIPAVWRQAFSLTPVTKILFSTDAYSIPEIFWLAARWGRWGLGLVLEELIALGAYSQDEAMEAAGQVLGRNAAALYGVSL